MTTATIARPKLVPGRAGRHWRRLRDLARSTAVALASPHKASLRRLADIPLTVAAVPLADFAAFHISHGWGFLATAASLVVVEHIIADPE